MQTAFKKDFFISFDLADPAGILFFGHAFTLAHRAFEAFVSEGLELHWQDWFQNPEWIVPLKNAEAQYRKPIQVGQSCLIEVSLYPIQHSSFKVQYLFWQLEEHCCTVETLHVFCDRHSNQKTSIPTYLRDKMHPFILLGNDQPK